MTAPAPALRISDARTWPAGLRRVVLWLVPVVFLLWVYRYGVRTWFIADDFAWIGLSQRVHSFHGLLNALFAPAAQGTIRPWSESGFFLLFRHFFGLDSLPLRICAFTTMAADAILVAWIAQRITASEIAGISAAILWAANGALSTPMAWNSAYNEILCPLFLLTALALFIRHTETGRHAFWWWQVVVFTLGFGVLEINVVYPALAAAYVLFAVPPEKRRKLLVSLVPLFCISVGYYLMHMAVAPLPKDGPYAVHIDSRIIKTLALYWKWSLRPETDSTRPGALIFWTLTVALTAFLVRQLTKHRHSCWFFAAWYLITLAPMLPLPLHHTGYYVTIPLIGLAMLAGWAVAEAFAAAPIWRITAVLLCAAYLIEMVSFDRTATRWWVDQSRQVKGLVLGVQSAEQTHPDRTIVLDAISGTLYDNSIAHSAIAAVGLREIYLAPSAAEVIHPVDDGGKLAHLILDFATLRNAVTHEQVVVYSDVGDHLRNITGVWERSDSGRGSPNEAPDPLPRRVEVGNPLFGYLLGPEWFGSEPPGVRWMPQQATLSLHGPDSSREKLLLEGFCPDSQLRASAPHLMVSVDGMPLETAEICATDSNFKRLFEVPASLVGRDSVKIAISVDHVLNEPGGNRRLGLLFGTIAFQ